MLGFRAPVKTFSSKTGFLRALIPEFLRVGGEGGRGLLPRPPAENPCIGPLNPKPF